MAFRLRTVQGTVVDSSGSPVVNGKVTFTLSSKGGLTPTHIVISRPLTAVTTSTGEFTASLWCDEDSSISVNYTVAFPTATNGQSDSSTSQIFDLAYEDGSPILLPLLIIGKTADELKVWAEFDVEAISAVSGGSIATWQDIASGNHDMIMGGISSPTFETNVINGLPTVRFLSSAGEHGYVGLNKPTRFYDIIMVMKHRGATFNALEKITLGQLTSDYLVGTASDTKWVNPTIADLEYRMNGVFYAANDMQAPMNRFSVVHLRTLQGLLFNGVINFASSASQGYPTPIDISCIILTKEAYTQSEYEAKVSDLMRHYGIPT